MHRKLDEQPLSTAVLRYPCPMPELVAALREADDAQLRAHEERLQTQLEAVRRELAWRAKHHRKQKEARERAELERLRAVFQAMSIPELRKYVDGRQPHYPVARRILNQRIEKERLAAKAATEKPRLPLPLPCDREADGDHWRNHGA